MLTLTQIYKFIKKIIISLIYFRSDRSDTSTVIPPKLKLVEMRATNIEIGINTFILYHHTQKKKQMDTI